MKICPICKTAVFDDMEVCYGCMYAFGSKPELEGGHQRGADAWTLRIELRRGDDDEPTWAMEFNPPDLPPLVPLGSLRTVGDPKVPDRTGVGA